MRSIHITYSFLSQKPICHVSGPFIYTEDITRAYFNYVSKEEHRSVLPEFLHLEH